MTVVGDRRPMSADRLYAGLNLELETAVPGPAQQFDPSDTDPPVTAPAPTTVLAYWRVRRIAPGNAGNLNLILDPVTDRGRPDETRAPSRITVRGGRMLNTVVLA